MGPRARKAKLNASAAVPMAPHHAHSGAGAGSWHSWRMLSPYDDYPIHQTALPLAQAGGGHPDFYDRFWFNGYTEDFYFAVAMGLYPNRGVIDAAFSVVHKGTQRSVFASGPIPLDRSETSVGPISIELVEPLRINRIRVDAAEHGLVADLTARARTAAYEEPRQTRYNGVRLAMDVTRATQMVGWEGTVRAGGAALDFSRPVWGTKDRSWGVRSVGDPAPAAPASGAAQLFFLWAPLNFEHECVHYMVFQDEHGGTWSETAALLPVIGADEPVFGPMVGAQPLRDAAVDVYWAPGLRRSNGASLKFEGELVEMEPLITFRMRGAGYLHPVWVHGRWHGGPQVAGEAHQVEDLDNLALDCIHVQQVMRCRWGDRSGLGVLEQLAIGPHQPSGLTGLLDGAPA